jgi:glutathione S-transferase
VNQWISALNSYYYPWMIYHIVHERIVFPPLDIAPDEKVVAKAVPHAEHALGLLEKELAQGNFLVGGAPTLADFFMFPSIVAFSMTPEGERMLAGKQRIAGWLARMATLDSVKRVRADFPPPEPIWHAREWATSHRPSYA